MNDLRGQGLNSGCIYMLQVESSQTSNSLVYIRARYCPMQLRGPPPKGKYENGLGSFSSHRSGLNQKGASWNLLLRWIAMVSAITQYPFFTSTSSRQKSWSASLMMTLVTGPYILAVYRMKPFSKGGSSIEVSLASALSLGRYSGCLHKLQRMKVMRCEVVSEPAKKKVLNCYMTSANLCSMSPGTWLQISCMRQFQSRLWSSSSLTFLAMTQLTMRVCSNHSLPFTLKMILDKELTSFMMVDDSNSERQRDSGFPSILSGNQSIPKKHRIITELVSLLSTGKTSTQSFSDCQRNSLTASFTISLTQAALSFRNLALKTVEINFRLVLCYSPSWTNSPPPMNSEMMLLKRRFFTTLLEFQKNC